MAQRKKNKPRRSVADHHQSKAGRNKPTKTKWWVLILLVPAIIAFIYTSIPKSPRSVIPTFTKEGELTINRNQEQLAHLDIEIADNENDTAQGLMYRTSMEEDQGMLFLMPTTEMQSFWMLNTEISLDIMFIGEDQRIINVAKSTTPKSLDPVSSTAPARYVLEVNAGYFDRKGLQIGDRIEWEQ